MCNRQRDLPRHSHPLTDRATIAQMTHVQIIDQSLRDGVQSLWGMRIRAGMVTGAGRYLD